MPIYSNGNVPTELLITFNSGWDDLGYWEHQWPAHTLALHNALVARAAARRAAAGLPPLPLRLQAGWTAYRPLQWQKTYRAILGLGAADPGKSSHGGTFEGAQTMAGDYAWQSVYRDCGGRDAFFADCRAVGLAPGMIMASRGYPDEDWHVIDPDPWGAVPAFASTTEFNPYKSEEDDDMLMLNITGLGIATPKVTLGPGVFGHFLPGDPVETVKNVARIQDDWQDITAADLPSFLRLWGCDLRIWDVRDGQFVVLDPFTGEVGAGKTWTASGAVRAAINGIKIPEVDPAPIAAAVAKAVKAGLESGEDAIAAVVAEALAAGIKIDAAEIAKAVSDELARRLRVQN